MTIDEAIARLTDLKKVAKNGGKTKICVYDDEYGVWDGEIMCELELVKEVRENEFISWMINDPKEEVSQILVIH